MSASLDGKVAIVTGASAGIGLAVSRRLVERGARVAMIARTRAILERVASSLGERALAMPCDVSDLSAVADLPAQVVARWGRLDVLVNNAGVNHRGPVASIAATKLTEVITTDLTAPVVLCRAAVDHIGAGGAIVNVASLAGMVPVHHEAAYSAAKAGLRAFTRVLADELPDVHVGVVCPGPVDTGFFGDLAKVPDLVFSQPMSTADEVADAVMRVVDQGTLEIAVPRLSGALCTIGYLSPSLARALRPALEKRGAANKRRYMARKQ